MRRLAKTCQVVSEVFFKYEIFIVFIFSFFFFNGLNLERYYMISTHINNCLFIHLVICFNN